MVDVERGRDVKGGAGAGVNVAEKDVDDPEENGDVTRKGETDVVVKDGNVQRYDLMIMNERYV